MNIGLPLTNSGNSLLEAGSMWTVAHTLDAKSPLAEHGRLDEDKSGVIANSELLPLYQNIVFLDVMITAHDPIYGQEVNTFHRYTLSDFVAEAKWADMLEMQVLKKRANGTPELTRAVLDHDKFDAYVAGVAQSR